MYAHSLTGRTLHKLAHLLDNCFRGSKLAALTDRLSVKLYTIFAASRLAQSLWFRDVSLPAWQHSLLYRLFALCQKLIKKCLFFFSRLMADALPQSISCRLYSFILSRPYLLFLLLGALGILAFPILSPLKALALPAAAAAALLIIHKPTFGLYLLAFSLPLVPNEALLLLAILAFASFLFHRLRTGNLALLPLAIEPALVLYLLVAVVATLASATFTGSLRDLAICICSFLVFFVLINQLQTKKELHTYLNFALAGALLVALYGIYQYIFGAPMQSGWVDATRSPQISVRVYSFFGNPNVMAEYLILIIPFGTALFFCAKNFFFKLLYLGTTGLLALSLLLTLSRGGLLGLLVALFVFALLKDRRIIILLFIILLLAAAVMPDMFIQRFASIGSPLDSSNAYRFTVWKETIQMIRDFPLTGVGLGYQAYQAAYPYYMLDRTKRPYHSHNTYLQALAETGLIGFLAFAWLLAGTAKRGLQAFRQGNDTYLKHIIIASLSALAGILTQGMGEVIIYLPKITMLFWLTAALVFLALKLDKKGAAC